jgi:hypothetical protein
VHIEMGGCPARVRLWIKQRPPQLFRALIEGRIPRRMQIRQLIRAQFDLQDTDEERDSLTWIEDHRRIILRDYVEISEEQQHTITDFTTRSVKVLQEIEDALHTN